MLKRKKSTKAVGNAGEDKAATFLEEHGYKIVSRNFRNRRGEIDIIAQKDETLIFAEVKTMPKGSPEDIPLIINHQKQLRIINTAKFFMLAHQQYQAFRIRFDALIIDMPAMGPVYHIENAFGEDG